MINILIEKITKEFMDIDGITAIGKSKDIVYIYVLNNLCKIKVNNLLQQKCNLYEIDHVKVIVSGTIRPLHSD